MPQNMECDFYDLLDEAYALSLSVRLDLEKAHKLLHRLRACADQAQAAGQADAEQQLRSAADDLEKRLAGQQPKHRL